MSIRKAKTWKAYRAWDKDDTCSECGHAPTIAESRQSWRWEKESIERHNKWHETASPEDLEFHEAEESMWRGLMDSMLNEIRPVLTRSQGESYIHTFEWGDK